MTITTNNTTANDELYKDKEFTDEFVSESLQTSKPSQPIAAKGGNDVCLNDAYTQWIEEVRLNSKPNTIAKYEGIFKNHIAYLKDFPISDIDRGVFNDFIQTLIYKNLSNKTINDILIVLNMLLCFSAEEYGISVSKVKYLREEHKETRYLSLEEQKRLTHYLITDIDVHKFGTLLAMYTGLRIGELCALRWEDISPTSIIVNKTMMRINENGHSHVIVTTPKSDSSVRVIPFPDTLRQYYNELKGEGYVLSTKRLHHTEPRYMQMKFEKYIKDCDLKDVTFHTLRHTFATRCIEADVDAKTVSELLGHSDTKITLNRYVHSSFELKKRSMDKMQKLLF